jgi:hypothetical protein
MSWKTMIFFVPFFDIYFQDFDMFDINHEYGGRFVSLELGNMEMLLGPE